jgi:hypothetical protein
MTRIYLTWKDCVDRHREHLLAEPREQSEIELSSISARGALPVTCDAELDSPANLAVEDQNSPVVRDPMIASGYGTSWCRITRGSSFHRSSLTATAGRSCTLSMMTGIGGGRVRWSAQSIIIATRGGAT